jgi:thiosulfate dehydrogenase
MAGRSYVKRIMRGTSGIRRLADVAAYATWLLAFCAVAEAREWPLKPEPMADGPLGLPRNIVAVPVPVPGETFVPPDIVKIPEDKQGDMVKLGRNIFTDTQMHARRYTGNGLNCASCHLSEGRKPDAAPLWAAYGMYPAFDQKAGAVLTYEERVQRCFRLSMNGLGPPVDSPEMQALVAYGQWLSIGAPARAIMPGRGLTRVRVAGEPSAERGKALYESRCAVCHGSDGQGVRRANRIGYQFPPLWGKDSWGRGSPLSDVAVSAAYIKGNMPLGRAYSLSDEEALDVAFFVNQQPRPGDPRVGWIARLTKRGGGS